MQVAAASLFRDSIRTIPTYFAQMAALRDALEKRGDHLRLIMLEGGSRDSSYPALKKGAKDFDSVLLKIDQGMPRYGSVEDPARFAKLSVLGNALLDAMRAWPACTTYLRIESDLRWDAATLMKLLDHTNDVPAAVPMILSRWSEGFFFYDTWGFRRSGERFRNWPSPFHPCLLEKGPLIRLDSAGSCMAVRAEYARRLSMPPEDVFVGFSKMLYSIGGSIWLDPRLAVYHPWPQ